MLNVFSMSHCITLNIIIYARALVCFCAVSIKGFFFVGFAGQHNVHLEFTRESRVNAARNCAYSASNAFLFCVILNKVFYLNLSLGCGERFGAHPHTTARHESVNQLKKKKPAILRCSRGSANIPGSAGAGNVFN